MNAREHMSDADVLTAVRESLSGMPLASPPEVEAIMARGRRTRRHRLIPGVTATLAVAAGAVLAVTMLAPAGHPAGPRAGSQAAGQASGQPAIQLAAWTVTKLADGKISVTIRELEDPAGLQSTLRADGVPASVTFASQQNPACRPYPAGTLLLERVFPTPYQAFPQLPHKAAARLVPAHGRPRALPGPSVTSTAVLIDPSALPGHTGVQLGISHDGGLVLVPQLVYATSQCTAS
jgi:hypothetical protein